MKLRNLIVASLAALLAVVSCKENEENLGMPSIKLDGNGTMTFEAAGGDQQINITATRDWMVETDADWVMVSPESGKASAEPQTVTVTALENTGMDRTTDIKFTIGMSFQTLTVTQAGPGGSAEQLVVYANDFDKEEATKTYGSGSSYPYLDQFDGWMNATGTGAANVTYSFKSMSARSNSTSNSSYSDYPGSGSNNLFFGSVVPAYFAVKNIALGGATKFDLSFGTEKYSSENGSVFTNSEFHIWLSADGGTKWVEFTDYTFAGGTTEGRWNLASASFSVPSGTETLSICMVVDVKSSYRMDDLQLVISESEGTVVDFTNAVEKNFDEGTTPGGNEGGEGAPESKGKKTVEEFISAADTQNYYELTGTVSGFNPTYCSFDLTDATGKIYVYSVLAESKAEWTDKIANDGTVTIYGKYLYYEQKSQHEVVDAWIVDFTPKENGDPQPPVGNGSLMTIAEVLNAGSATFADGSYIEAVVISDRSLGNLTSKKGLYVQDETAGLQLRTSSDHTFNFGDKVRVDLSGVALGEYGGAVQVSIDLGKVSVISSGNSVQPKTVTVDDFLANKYEGQYVAIEGVQVVEADLSKTFVMGGAHTNINVETADGKTFVIFSSKYATYGSETVPQGSGTIKGISSINNGTMQVIFAQTSDYAGLTGERFEGTGSGDGGDDVTPPSGEGDAVLTFPDGNSKSVSSYTDTWEAVSGGYTWTIKNFNNNKNEWAYIKCGRKNDPSVASISVGVGDKVSEVVVVVDKCLDESKVNSAKLIVASDADFTNVVETVSGSAATGTQKFTVSSPAAGMYYKLEYDCVAHGSKNGIIQISKVTCVTVE